MKLVGWIQGKETDKAELRLKFNVKGPMDYDEEKGVFKYCILDSLIDARKLFLEWPRFWLGAFTPMSDEEAELRQKGTDPDPGP